MLRSNSSSPENLLPNMSGSMLDQPMDSEQIQNPEDLALNFQTSGTASRMGRGLGSLAASGISPSSLANLQTAAFAGQLNSSNTAGPMGSLSSAVMSHHLNNVPANQRQAQQQQSQLANLQQLYWSSLMYQKAISGSVKTNSGINLANMFSNLPTQIPVNDPLSRPLALTNPSSINNIPLAALVQHQVARNNIPFFQ